MHAKLLQSEGHCLLVSQGSFKRLERLIWSSNGFRERPAQLASLDLMGRDKISPDNGLTCEATETIPAVASGCSARKCASDPQGLSHSFDLFVILMRSASTPPISLTMNGPPLSIHCISSLARHHPPSVAFPYLSPYDVGFPPFPLAAVFSQMGA